MKHDVTKQETYLINSIQDLMLEPKLDIQNLADVLAPPLDVLQVKDKGDNRTSRLMPTLMYEMTAQEIQLQKQEEKYGIYMSTIGYEGDGSDLNSKTESDSDATTYPYIG